MTATAPARTALPHLSAALIACGIALGIVVSGWLAAIHLEHKTIHVTAPQDFFIKNQGLALQRAAAHTPNVLLLYGSSELTDPVPNRAPEYFANAPTGFEVCPIGKPGATSLVILQKIAALGDDLRGRKVAISISPSFFFRHEVKADAYAGNFSLPAASALVFGNSISAELKREIAKRMCQFPQTLAKSTLLRMAVDALASNDSLGRATFAAIWPLGKLQDVIYDFQDHFEALVYIASGERKISRHELRTVLHGDEPNELGVPRRPKGIGSIGRRGEEKFRERINEASEWIDIELLFRTLDELGARALVLSMPLNGIDYDAEGVSRTARQVYYDRVKQLAARYRIQLEDFEDHDVDPAFQIARREHPTTQGWRYYDDALDKFFHQRAD